MEVPAWMGSVVVIIGSLCLIVLTSCALWDICDFSCKRDVKKIAGKCASSLSHVSECGEDHPAPALQMPQPYNQLEAGLSLPTAFSPEHTYKYLQPSLLSYRNRASECGKRQRKGRRVHVYCRYKRNSSHTGGSRSKRQTKWKSRSCPG